MSRDLLKLTAQHLRHLTAGMIAIMLLTGIFATAAPAAAAAPEAPQAAPMMAQCTSSPARAWDMGGGWPWNRNYVVDVSGVTRNDGFFIYYDPNVRSWKSIRLSAHYLINNNTGIRFGVSTAWAHSNPFWSSTAWRYIYPC